MEERFRERPILFPLLLLLCGAGAFGWMQLYAHTLGAVLWYVMGLAAIAAIAGAVLLPIGVVVKIRRQVNAVVLRCPSCGAESRSSDTPFRVEYPPYVEYAHVVCSNCNADFTVSKYARLV